MALQELVRANARDVRYRSETVQSALDYLNYEVVFATKFGVVADGVTDNADALFALGQYLSDLDHPVRVVFPVGVSMVGSQRKATALETTFSYEPTYWSRPWADASQAGWFSVHNTNQAHVLDMSNWTLKMNPGMKLGSFDPTTGAVYNPPSLPFYVPAYQASQGYLIKLYKAPNITVLRGTTDGNVASVVWGGYYGDTGYQTISQNIWVNQSSGCRWIEHTGKNAPLDCLYVGESGDSFSPGHTTQIKGSLFDRCVFQDAGRNIISYTGGANALFRDCETWRAGNNCIGIAGHGSGPASCLDVEAEGGKIFNLTFLRCKFMHGGDVAVVGGFAQPYDVDQVQFLDCTMHCATGVHAFINYARNCVLEGCRIYGGVSLDTGTKQDPTALIDCEFFNRVDGQYLTNFSISGITNLMRNCTISFEIPPTGLPGGFQVFNVSGFQPLNGGYGNAARIENLHINISGNTDLLSANIGGFFYFSDVTCHTDAAGLTGSNTLIVNMQSNTANPGGCTVGGSNKLSYGGTMLNRPGTGIYYDSSMNVRVHGTIVPGADSLGRIGSRGFSFTHAWLKDGFLTYSPDGTAYRVRVNNGGTLVAVLDSSTP